MSEPVPCNLCGFTAEPIGGRFRPHNTSPENGPSLPCANSNRLVDHPMPVPSPNVAKPAMTPEERQHAWTQRLTQRNLDKLEQAHVDRSRRLAGGDQEALDQAMQAEFDREPEAFLGGMPFETPFDNVIPEPWPQPAKIQPALGTNNSKLDVLQELRYMADKIKEKAIEEHGEDAILLGVELLEARIDQLLRQPW